MLPSFSPVWFPPAFSNWFALWHHAHAPAGLTVTQKQQILGRCARGKTTAETAGTFERTISVQAESHQFIDAMRDSQQP